MIKDTSKKQNLKWKTI